MSLFPYSGNVQSITYADLASFYPLYFIATTNKRKLYPKIASLPSIFLFPCPPVVCKACHSLLLFMFSGEEQGDTSQKTLA